MAAPRVEPWSVVYERSIGELATAPVLAPDGGWVSSGQRFDRDGRFVGLLAIEVGGGRTISNLRVLLGDGRAIAEDTERGVIVGRADQPPERAKVVVPGNVGAIAVAADGRRVALHRDRSVVVLGVPALKPAETIELGDNGSVGPVAIAFLADGGLAYATPCRGAKCSGSGLEVRDAKGQRKQLRDGGIDALALSADAAAIVAGKQVTVIGLPDGATRGSFALGGELDSGTTAGGAIAVAPGGDHVVAVMCKEVVVWGREPTSTTSGTGGTQAWGVAYRGTVTRGSGENGCAYPSGLVFAPDGKRVAIATRELTVLGPGPARDAVSVQYQPKLPEGFSAEESAATSYMPPPGSGLALAPRVLGEWNGPARVRAVVRDSDEMAGFVKLEQWRDAILTRFEPMVRDGMRPDRIAASARRVMPYMRAFVDARGRRNLEYTILVRGGCDEADRHVRWIEDGKALVEIDIESLGIDVAQMRAWMTAWFDAPLSTSAPAERGKLAHYGHRDGPC
ncbi:MAG TPA: hypothetical protein VFQ53_03430 [Kofleriaceae bacterium]|nr:hypothetical protein [Kofleriaceae bacterium]